jgi:putative sterol carrier protein
MADPTAILFEALSRRGYHSIMERHTGTLRFDLTEGEQTHYWLLTIQQGNLAVSRETAPADCVVLADKAVFDGIVTGELNALSAFLRGVVGIDGDIELVTAFRRLLMALAQAQEALPAGDSAGGQP